MPTKFYTQTVMGASGRSTAKVLSESEGLAIAAEAGLVSDSIDHDQYATKDQLSEYALKSEIPDAQDYTDLIERVTELESKEGTSAAYDDTEIKARVAELEAKEDSDTVYDDTELKARVAELEAKEDSDTVYDDTALVARVEALEAKEDSDTVYDDTALVARVEALEAKEDSDTVYDDTALVARVEALEAKEDSDTVYDDTALVARVEALEAKEDSDTIYDDTALVARVATLEETKQDKLKGYSESTTMVSGTIYNRIEFKTTTDMAANSVSLIRGGVDITATDVNNDANTHSVLVTPDGVYHACGGKPDAKIIDTDMLNDALSTGLADYAKKSDVANYVTESDLTEYAKKSELSDYIGDTDLSAYAKTEDLDEYAKYTDLTNIVAEYNGDKTSVSVEPTGIYVNCESSSTSEVAGIAIEKDSVKLTGMGKLDQDIIGADDLNTILTDYAKKTDISASSGVTSDDLDQRLANYALTTDVERNYVKSDYLYNNYLTNAAANTTYAKADDLATVAKTGSYSDLESVPDAITHLAENTFHNVEGSSRFEDRYYVDMTGVFLESGARDRDTNSYEGVSMYLATDGAYICSTKNPDAKLLDEYDISTVATTGSYNDLTDVPGALTNIVNVTDHPTGSETYFVDISKFFFSYGARDPINGGTEGASVWLAKDGVYTCGEHPDSKLLTEYDISTVATTGSYNDLTDVPSVIKHISNSTSPSPAGTDYYNLDLGKFYFTSSEKYGDTDYTGESTLFLNREGLYINGRYPDAKLLTEYDLPALAMSGSYNDLGDRPAWMTFLDTAASESGTDVSTIMVAYKDVVEDANSYFKIGWSRCSKGVPTTNLPAECLNNNSNYGVICFIPQNINNKTGIQIYYPINGDYKGKQYVRSVLNGNFGEWTRIATTAEIPDAITVDSTLNESSTNAVQNGVVTGYINSLINAVSNTDNYASLGQMSGRYYHTDGTKQIRRITYFDLDVVNATGDEVVAVDLSSITNIDDVIKFEAALTNGSKTVMMGYTDSDIAFNLYYDNTTKAIKGVAKWDDENAVIKHISVYYTVASE